MMGIEWHTVTIFFDDLRQTLQDERPQALNNHLFFFWETKNYFVDWEFARAIRCHVLKFNDSITNLNSFADNGVSADDAVAYFFGKSRDTSVPFSPLIIF